MFCKNCGTQMADDTVFCPACGTKAEVSFQQEATPETGWNMPPADKKKSGGKIALMIIAAVVILALLVGSVFLLAGLMGKLWNRKDADQSHNDSKAPTTSAQEGESNKKDESDDPEKTPNGTVGDINSKKNYTVDNEQAEEKKNVVVATVGNQTLTNGELQAHYWSAVYEYVNYYYGSSGTGPDITKPLNEQYYENTGKTYQQWFLELALENWYQHAIIKQMAEDNNYQFGDAYKEYMNSIKERVEALRVEYQYTDMEKFIDEQFFPGCSYDIYLKYVALNYIAPTYYNQLYNSLKPTRQQLEDYYNAHETEFKENKTDKTAGNYYDVRHILISIEGAADSNGNYSDAQWAACKVAAEKLLNEFKNGKATEESFAELAMKHSKDPGSSENGGLYSSLTKDTGFIQGFKDWYLDESRNPGDTGLVKNTESSVQGYHIMYFSGSAPIWETEAQTALMTEYADKQVEEAKEKYSINVDYKKIVLSNVELTA